MRVRIIFGLINKGAAVPFHHQYLLSGFVDSILNKNKDIIPRNEFLCFSGLKGQIKVGKDGIYFYSNKVTLVFSCPDAAFVDQFLKLLFMLPEVKIGNMKLKPLEVDKEAYPEFKQEMKFVCLSPIVALGIEDAGDNVDSLKDFISPTTDSFSDALFENTINRMAKAGTTEEELAAFSKFQIIPDRAYLSKVKHQDKKFARVFPVFLKSKKVEIRGYTFPFTLYADPKVQKFLFECGLGAFTNRGFGMLDIANSDPNARAEHYDVKPE